MGPVHRVVRREPYHRHGTTCTTDHPHSLVHSMAVINYPEMWIVKTIKINSHTHTRTGIARDDALGTQEHPCYGAP